MPKIFSFNFLFYFGREKKESVPLHTFSIQDARDTRKFFCVATFFDAW